MQDKLSKHSSQVDLLKELLNLQKDMITMMLSMLEGELLIFARTDHLKREISMQEIYFFLRDRPAGHLDHKSLLDQREPIFDPIKDASERTKNETSDRMPLKNIRVGPINDVRT